MGAARPLRRGGAILLTFGMLLSLMAMAAPAQAQVVHGRTTLDLVPDEAENLIGAPHEVTAIVNGRLGRPLPNRYVEFEVLSETGTALPQTTTAEPTSGFDVTDRYGQADFTFRSLAEGTYTIRACTTTYLRVEVCDTVTKTYSTDFFLDALTAEGGYKHLEAFQAIADANGGTRVSGSPGYDQSADYVIEQLTAAGYSPEVFEFEYLQFSETGPSTLERIEPDPTLYEPYQGGISEIEGDYAVMDYSGSGDVTAPVTGVDLLLPPTGGSTSGCEPEDFAGFTPGNIALVQRGTCTFDQKAQNAQTAGASAVVIFNEGNDPGRTELLLGTLGAESAVTIPVVGISFALGEEFAGQVPGLVLHVVTQTQEVPTTSSNVIADTPGGDPDNVVIVGAHLDSVLEGPGINDNGSGSAAILEVALQMAELGIEPENTIRFAWWGAEESGLVGSTEYVNTVLFDAAGNPTAEGEDVALYLNFDMVGSPNFVRFTYDGDESTFPAPAGVPVPEGSAQIEADFDEFFAEAGLASEDTEFSGRSDYQAFINNGIPAGGLFTGAEGTKTEEQAALYGGEVGVPYDPCYHQACDTIDNVNEQVFGEMIDAIGNSVLIYAYSTAEVTGG